MGTSQKAKLVRIKFHIEMFSFYLPDTFFVLNYFHSSDSSSSQLQIKINHNFGNPEHRLKIQKAKLDRIKFAIELLNFYMAKTFF